jgi:hypothetical protein
MNSQEVPQLTQIKASLASERFERLSNVTARGVDMANLINNLAQLQAKQRPVIEDALAREEYKEKTDLSLQSHQKLQAQLLEWLQQHVAYLTLKENITSVADARVCVSTHTCLLTNVPLAHHSHQNSPFVFMPFPIHILD